jgi:hypothetical protein
MIFKHTVSTAKRTQHFSITKNDFLTLSAEIISVYSEDHTTPTDRQSVEKKKKGVLPVVKQEVHCNSHRALKC